MMINNGNKRTCEFADEIVAYIYDESSESERRVFESHLTGCMGCTDEFAEISNARFSVFEWRKEEFSHLSTPEIIIPYVPRTQPIAEEAPAGMLAGLRGWLGMINIPVAVAAALMVCLGVGLLTMKFVGGSDQLAANNVPAVVADTHALEVPAGPATGDGPDVKAPTLVGVPAARPVKVVQTHSTHPYRQTSPESRKLGGDVADRGVQNRKAPVLNGFEDNDDKSLRLADLFDEVGMNR